MRPRIFSLMLTAFAMVIVLGVGGMSGFFWLAVANFEHRSAAWVSEELALAQSGAARLGAHYVERGSWRGVEEPFAAIQSELGSRSATTLTLIDTRGRVLASSGAMLAPAAPAAPLPPVALPGSRQTTRPIGQADSWEMTMMAFERAIPVEAEGLPVGTLLVQVDGRDLAADGDPFNRRRFAQGVASAGLALAAVLLGLAAFFSGRISTPLRQLTGAARSLAGGDMTVRVRPSAVREVGELAGAFNSMADTLVRADEQRRQLTADVAHELRTPLSIIKGRLEGIQDGIYRPDEQIDGLLDEVALLERLIDDLRLLALADAGQLPLYPESVDPAHLVADARRSFAHQAEERGVSMCAESAPGLPELNADPQRIAQVLGNLVGNALRHTPAGGSVSLRAALQASPQADSYVLFEVSDSGAGIPPADLPHIFDRFYRADRARSRSSGGAGLGLAIARRIVEAHGGRIWAESEPGRGTTMRFSLPVR
jgi:two-component system OmpR family sensor kinase/two-component system sensor histidine kinase BaeS